MLSRALLRAGSATKRGASQLHLRGFGTWSHNPCTKSLSSAGVPPPAARWGQPELLKHMQPLEKYAAWSEALKQAPVIPTLLGSKPLIFIPDMERPSENMNASISLAGQTYLVSPTAAGVSEPNWDTEGMFASSVLKKRRKKMNKHKWKKRRRLNRSYSR
mmetsp:Transcript_37676/g.118989  ORF Transcript_37676/g.118989 Transcript_37676/m.118989 type:complete len:160 (-) Transcript_37676:1276-1755(-)